MSKSTNPLRRRAGLLSALAKCYSAAKTLMYEGGAVEDALQLQEKISNAYNKYLESHDDAMDNALGSEREQSLIDSFMRNDIRHDKIVDQLSTYIDDGTKPEPSLSASSQASSRSSMKTANTTILSINKSQTSSTSQARLSEARVQADLAKADVENLRKLQEAQQKKLQLEREEAQRQLKLDEENRRIEIERRILKDESERRQR